MQNQNYRLFILLFFILASLAGCTLPQDQATPPPPTPMNISPEEPEIQEEEPSAPESASESNTPVEEEAPSGGGSGSTGVSDSQNPLPSAVNLEESSIDLEKLGKEIVGGGGGDNCSEMLGIKTEQEILLRYQAMREGWQMCFLNYPLAMADIHLSTQSGLYDTNLSLEPSYGAYDLDLYLPSSISRDGPLQVEFTVEGTTYFESFDIQNFDQVSIYQDSTNMLDAGNHPNIDVGEKIELLGAYLQPSTTVYVGIYGISEFNANIFFYLVDQFEIITNEAGEFLGTVHISEKYHQGKHIIYYGYDPDLFGNKRDYDERYERFIVSDSSPTWQPCPADYASRLRVGDVGFVSNDPPYANRVRSTPSPTGEIMGEIQPGENFVILDGPVCDGGWVWWYVQGANNSETGEALTGWTSEGDVNSYWLVKDIGN